MLLLSSPCCMAGVAYVAYQGFKAQKDGNANNNSNNNSEMRQEDVLLSFLFLSAFYYLEPLLDTVSFIPGYSLLKLALIGVVVFHSPSKRYIFEHLFLNTIRKVERAVCTHLARLYVWLADRAVDTVAATLLLLNVNSSAPAAAAGPSTSTSMSVSNVLLHVSERALGRLEALASNLSLMIKQERTRRLRGSLDKVVTKNPVVFNSAPAATAAVRNTTTTNSSGPIAKMVTFGSGGAQSTSGNTNVSSDTFDASAAVEAAKPTTAAQAVEDENIAKTVTQRRRSTRTPSLQQRSKQMSATMNFTPLMTSAAASAANTAAAAQGADAMPRLDMTTVAEAEESPAAAAGSVSTTAPLPLLDTTSVVSNSNNNNNSEQPLGPLSGCGGGVGEAMAAVSTRRSGGATLPSTSSSKAISLPQTAEFASSENDENASPTNSSSPSSSAGGSALLGKNAMNAATAAAAAASSSSSSLPIHVSQRKGSPSVHQHNSSDSGASVEDALSVTVTSTTTSAATTAAVGVTSRRRMVMRQSVM